MNASLTRDASSWRGGKGGKRLAHRSSRISWRFEGVKSNDNREVSLSDATRERRGKCLPSFVCRFVRHLAGTLAAAPNPRKLKYLRESLTGLVNNKPRGRISLHSFVIPRRGRGLSLPPSRESGTFLSFLPPKDVSEFQPLWRIKFFLPFSLSFPRWK